MLFCYDCHRTIYRESVYINSISADYLVFPHDHCEFLTRFDICRSLLKAVGLGGFYFRLLDYGACQEVCNFSLSLNQPSSCLWFHRRFFRTRCEYIAAQKKHPRPRLDRSQSFFLKNISSPIATFKQREPATRQPEGNSREDDSPGVQVIGPTPMATLGQSFESEKSPYETHILTDVQTFSSSPRAPSTQLPDETEVHAQQPPTVEFAMTTSVSSRMPVPYYNAKLNTRGRSPFHHSLLPASLTK